MKIRYKTEIKMQRDRTKIGKNIMTISMHIWVWACLMFSRFGQIRQAGRPSVVIAYSNIYLQKGYDKRSQREVGGFLELGVKFFDG